MGAVNYETEYRDELDRWKTIGVQQGHTEMLHQVADTIAKLRISVEEICAERDRLRQQLAHLQAVLRQPLEFLVLKMPPATWDRPDEEAADAQTQHP